MLGVKLELNSSISNAKSRLTFWFNKNVTLISRLSRMDRVKVVLSRTVTSCAEFISRTLLSHYSASTVFTELVVPKLPELKLYMFLCQLN